MLPRLKRPCTSAPSETRSSSLEAKSNQVATSSSPTKSVRSEKRKATDPCGPSASRSRVDPDYEQSSEYLRRKHNFIKASIRVDYQPDICKDFKETGFCGFGDSCKFLHDRSDYKHGWQLEQEWAKGQYKDEDKDKYLIKGSDEEDEDDQDDKNRCKICQEPYKDPIMTKCKHYFCSACADKECVDKCFVCDKPTSGIFKIAKPSQIVNQLDSK